MDDKTGETGAEVTARQAAIDLLEQAISRIGHPRNLDIEDCPSCGIRAAQNLILNHWRTHDELRAQLNAVRDKAETWYKRYKDQGREDYASAEKTNAAISTAITQLQDGDARAALDTLMLERYGYPLPEDYVWKAKDEPARNLRAGQKVEIGGATYSFGHYHMNDIASVLDSEGKQVVARIADIKPLEPRRTEPAPQAQQVDPQTIQTPEYTIRIRQTHGDLTQFQNRMWETINAHSEKEMIAGTFLNILTRLEAVEAQLRTKPTMPSAEEQK